MNRPLVLTSEDARHPFRRSLPAHVTHVDMPQPQPIPSSDTDWKLFLLSFAAFFYAIYSFIY